MATAIETMPIKAVTMHVASWILSDKVINVPPSIVLNNYNIIGRNMKYINLKDKEVVYGKYL